MDEDGIEKIEGVLKMWRQRLIDTDRGTFELFEAGQGEPLAVTHLYSEFNERGNTFANPFAKFYQKQARKLLLQAREGQSPAISGR